VMERLLTPVKDKYDFILIDCYPSLGLITVNALTAADSVIIPVQAEYFALEGISKLLNTIRIIKSRLNPALQIEGFLLTMYDARLRLANQIYEELKGHFAEMVFDTVIPLNIRLSEAPSHGLPALLYDAESRGATSHVLLAIGLPHEVAHGSLRLSLSEENTMDEVEYIISTVPEIVEYLRSMSPVWEALTKGEIEHVI